MLSSFKSAKSVAGVHFHKIPSAHFTIHKHWKEFMWLIPAGPTHNWKSLQHHYPKSRVSALHLVWLAELQLEARKPKDAFSKLDNGDKAERILRSNQAACSCQTRESCNFSLIKGRSGRVCQETNIRQHFKHRP